MWPLFFDMSKEQCLMQLRQLELEAYSALVTAFRAQGPLTSEKRKILKEVSKTLFVSSDRFKGEIRRAANDERLNTIAYHANGGAINFEDWHYEGRRQLPAVIQRICPQTLQPIINEGGKQMYENEESGHPKDDSKPRNYSSTTDTDQAYQKMFNSKKVHSPETQMAGNDNGILHKTLSLPVTKITKLNMDKFKIVPGPFQPSNTKHFIGNKRIIPISQLHLLNQKLKPKGPIKVLPINGKIVGKNITMTRLTGQQLLNTQQFLPKIKADNVSEEMDTSCDESGSEQIVIETSIKNIDTAYNENVLAPDAPIDSTYSSLEDQVSNKGEEEESADVEVEEIDVNRA